ncbi:DUF3427 domain-containing protein [Niabella terrae]
MITGIYESLITASLRNKLASLDRNRYFLNEMVLDKEEAVRVLSMHLQSAIAKAFNGIKTHSGSSLEKQIEVSNRLIQFLHQEIAHYDFEEDIIDGQGALLNAVFDKIHADYPDLELRLHEIMPATRLTQSALFTGGNFGLSLDSELKKEIRSANRIDFLVSFIKWKAIVILREALAEFISNGGHIRIITTTYMGATDARAIQELAAMPNTKVKVSYNSGNERLHAKAYLFYRNSGFHTGYIGSSNFSRSALTDGLEWNVKVTTKEIPHIIDKFQKTFESYWQHPEFEAYDGSQVEKLEASLKASRMGKTDLAAIHFFDIRPYHYQSDILSKLQVERTLHGRRRNLVVAATGTGKTIISAFDFKDYYQQHPTCKFLFIAHRIEILKQACVAFRNILKDQNFGQILGGGEQPGDLRHLFATIQSFSNRIKNGLLESDYYDYVVIDEVHHAQADSYQRIIEHLKPDILLGLTATPERADGKSVLKDFEDHIAAEIRLPDALNHKLLCPFQYFAVSDSVDLDKVKWVRGQYDTVELTKIYNSNDQRVRDILSNLHKYCKDMHQVKALGFCISIAHAKFMQQKFEMAGLKAGALTSENAHQRGELLQMFKQGQINYLFVVDIFNEGVDIPEIDTVLFLRPTESLTIFLQQLGRGLRLSHKKEVLTVLDFVGNAHEQYDFESKFRALIGKTNTTVKKEIENDFVHLPLGCSIQLERKAREVILANISRATSLRKEDFIKRIQRFGSETTQPLNLASFFEITNIPFQRLYLRGTWTSLLHAAGKLESYDTTYEENYHRMLSKKWAATNSWSYFKFLLGLADKHFEILDKVLTDLDRRYLTMLHYDFWGKALPDMDLSTSIRTIGSNKDYVREIRQYLSYRISLIDFEESPCESLPYLQPLQLHARYTRDQILAAFDLSTLDHKNPSREGYAENKTLKTELLFVNLQKSEEEFSPTTMYEDYAISEYLFHWQSQSTTSDTSPKGQSYINQQQLNKTILLFIRETRKDELGNTAGYVFVGPVSFQGYEGSKPMSITWALENPIPDYLWTASAKMAVG